MRNARRLCGLMVVAAMVGVVAACGGDAPAEESAPQAATTPAGDRIGGVPAYAAPDDWGTNHNEKFTFRYPPAYTADLDFGTREIVVKRVADGVELIRVAYFDSDDPVFRKVAEDVPFFNEILGSAARK